MTRLHGPIYRSDSFVSMLRYCANLKAIRYESMRFNRIVANKSHRVIVAIGDKKCSVNATCVCFGKSIINLILKILNTEIVACMQPLFLNCI